MELAKGNVCGDHAGILLCGKLCLFVIWLCTVAVQWFCLFSCIALFFIDGQGLCLTVAWSCMLLACHRWAVPRLCSPWLTWLHPASLSSFGSVFPYMWSLRCRGSFLPFTILLLSLPLSQGSQWFSDHCCPRRPTNSNSYLFCHSGFPESQRLLAQGTSAQCYQAVTLAENIYS